jgi:hypothetical protein
MCQTEPIATKTRSYEVGVRTWPFCNGLETHERFTNGLIANSNNALWGTARCHIIPTLFIASELIHGEFTGAFDLSIHKRPAVSNQNEW